MQAMMISGNFSGVTHTNTAITASLTVNSKQGASGELSPEEQKVVAELKKRDADVRRHEMAHKRVAGIYALGVPSYQYQVGPDGRRYAVGGEVSIDTSEVSNNPEATIRKAEQVKRAALAAENNNGKRPGKVMPAMVKKARLAPSLRH
jgi:hypothetical protein